VTTERTTPCACSCGCNTPVTITGQFAEVFAPHTRCNPCHTHTHEYPNKPAPTPHITTNTITPDRPATNEEKADATEALHAIEKQRHNTAMKRWTASLGGRFENAVIDRADIAAQYNALVEGHWSTASLLLYGTNGRGKTWNAVGYARQAVTDGLVPPSRVLFGTEASLLSDISNMSFSDKEYTAQQAALRKMMSGHYRIVVIDDVGRGGWKIENAKNDLLWRLIDTQYARGNILILTTNLPLRPEGRGPGFIDYIGKSSQDRLMEMCGRVGVIEFTNNDPQHRNRRSAITQHHRPHREIRFAHPDDDALHVLYWGASDNDENDILAIIERISPVSMRQYRLTKGTALVPRPKDHLPELRQLHTQHGFTINAETLQRLKLT
jgi:DNA replication protein DnaC